MAKEIKMPQLSDTMDGGKILGWNKKVGDVIGRGDILAEVETDKANLEIESFDKGVLIEIVIPADQTAMVGDVIGYLGEAGEKVASNSSKTETPVKEAEPVVVETVEVEPVVVSEPAPSKPQVTSAIATPIVESSGERIKVSPIARKMAKELSLDLSKIQGSGPGGRIIKKDIELSASAGGSHPSPAATPQVVRTPVAQTKQVSVAVSTLEASSTELSKMRSTIARRMQESVRDIPHFYTTVSINMSEAMSLRASFKKDDSLKTVSINHLIIKAAAYALTKEPRVNCSLKDDKIVNSGEINVGLVTSVEGGLLIPVIQNANELAIRDLALQARSAIDRARKGKPSSQDLSGGTFTISNMGMFDVENFTAIISPGQGAILAVSSVQETPIACNGEVKIAPIMKVTLSVDHRIIDGVMAGNFLGFFKEGLEKPALLFV